HRLARGRLIARRRRVRTRFCGREAREGKARAARALAALGSETTKSLDDPRRLTRLRLLVREARRKTDVVLCVGEETESAVVHMPSLRLQRAIECGLDFRGTQIWTCERAACTRRRS